MKKELKIGDWVLFKSYNNGISYFDLLGRVKEFDDFGDPGILPYNGSINTDEHRDRNHLWYRFKRDYKKISEDEAMIYMLENS